MSPWVVIQLPVVTFAFFLGITLRDRFPEFFASGWFQPNMKVLSLPTHSAVWMGAGHWKQMPNLSKYKFTNIDSSLQIQIQIQNTCSNSIESKLFLRKIGKSGTSWYARVSCPAKVPRDTRGQGCPILNANLESLFTNVGTQLKTNIQSRTQN